MSNAITTDLKRYFKHSYNDDIVEICKPLRNLKISFFLYARYYNDGSQAWLINDPNWQDHFHENELYNNDCLRDNKFDSSYDFHLWKCMPCQDIFEEAKAFNIDHGITLVEQHEEYQDTWHFGTETENHGIYDLYTNKTQLLERFTHYFRDRAKPFIEKAEKFRIRTSTDKAIKSSENYDFDIDQVNVENFIAETELKRFYLNKTHGSTYITPRELQCIHWLKTGKSVEEIAMILEVKTSTAQSHIENIKKKFDCYKQFSLGYSIAKHNVLI